MEKDGREGGREGRSIRGKKEEVRRAVYILLRNAKSGKLRDGTVVDRAKFVFSLREIFSFSRSCSSSSSSSSSESVEFARTEHTA